MYTFTFLIAALLAVALAADPFCKGGIRSKKVCCPKACGTCGGPKCGERSRTIKSLCCLGAIYASPDNCLTSYPPCKITHTKPGHMAGSRVPDPMCETGLMKRSACCPAECSRCGGKDCIKRGRLIKSDCCLQSILRSNKSCSDRGPPCVVTKPKMTMEPIPEPTPEPVPDVCKKMKSAKIGGCFCYLTITKKILPKGRKKVIELCKKLFGRRNLIKLFASKCKGFAHGKLVREKQTKLVARVNELIPICLPEGTPLIVLKDDM